MPVKSKFTVDIASKAKKVQENAAETEIPSVVATQPKVAPVVKKEKPAKQEGEQVNKGGRPRGSKKSTVERSNGRTIYFESEHNLKLDLIYAYDKLNRQDVIRCALQLFLDKYLIDGSHLKQEGIDLVSEYYKKTHIDE